MINEFIENYVKKLKGLLDGIDSNAIADIIRILETAQHKKSNIYVMGNGGSAATASHMVNDLGVGLQRRGLMYFRISSLADNTPVTTALANDVGYDNIFVSQLVNRLEPDDVIIAISCSGDSPNIVRACEYAAEVGATIIGVTGFGGGRLKELADISFHVDTPKGEYGLVEDMHLILDHIIYSYYISKGGSK
ncbi:SIS domain-containing protein [Seleniivibrio sp.]|uniref:SIS domain-containing protein n=1 Tax=Seleniivibrio sp. TaxID=2898801 RepID=UPI0025E608F6|nr:SIS domain-containing protein [Seleniivibrio sp.]MCD8554289.1 SIS domain-containing protein [Seleniivibrio sp.]